MKRLMCIGLALAAAMFTLLASAGPSQAFPVDRYIVAYNSGTFTIQCSEQFNAIGYRVCYGQGTNRFYVDDQSTSTPAPGIVWCYDGNCAICIQRAGASADWGFCDSVLLPNDPVNFTYRTGTCDWDSNCRDTLNGDWYGPWRTWTS